MAQIFLTDKFIRSLRVSAGRTEYRDTLLAGFGLRVSAGHKRWFFMYRSPTARGANGLPLRRRADLGLYPEKSLAMARQEAAQLHAQVEAGTDPLAPEVGNEHRMLSFDELAEDYLERRSKPNKVKWRDDQWFIHRLLLPEWKGCDPREITAAEIRQFLKRASERGPSVPKRALSCLSQVFEWGIAEHGLPGNTTRLVREPRGGRRRTRVLTLDELARIWAACQRDANLGMALLLRLRLLTAQRGIELCKMNRRDIEPDPDGAWWNLPEKITKSGRPHRVFLSPWACELLTQGWSSSMGWIFPGEKDPSQHFNPSPHMLRRIRERSGVEDWWATDLRRTAATQMARNGVPRFIIRRVLNHADHEITAVYDLYSYDKEVKQAMLVLEKAVRAAVEPSQPTGPERAAYTSGAAFSERSADR